MILNFGKFKGRHVDDLPAWYCEWLAGRELHGPLKAAVFRRLGRPVPPEPVETVQEIEDRVFRQVMGLD